MLQTVLWGALLVATSLLNTYTYRIKIGRVMSKILYTHIWTYATNIIDLSINWANINIFESNQLYIKGRPKLHILYEHQLNIYLTVDSVVK